MLRKRKKIRTTNLPQRENINRNSSLPRGDNTAEGAQRGCEGMKSIQSLNVYSTNVQ
jgi:hypothetical protein